VGRVAQLPPVLARRIIRYVRRVVLTVLLALVLAPSIATAARYLCAYDGLTRSQCCCPAAGRAGAPGPGPVARAACCCTVIESAPAVRSAWSDPTPFELRAIVIAAAVPVADVAAPVIASAVCARPRAQSDPPDSLFARYCSRLL
jgi:hypothetical protein